MARWNVGVDADGEYWFIDGVGKIYAGSRVAFFAVDEPGKGVQENPQVAGTVVSVPMPKDGAALAIVVNEGPRGVVGQTWFVAPIEVIGLVPETMDREDVEKWLAS